MSDASPYPDYVDGASADAIDQAFDRIGKAMLAHRAQFLFGAGMSRDSELPLGSELAASLLRLFFPVTGKRPPNEERIKELTREFPFEAIVEAVENKPGAKREELTGVLREIFLAPEIKPSEAHHDFLSLWNRSSARALDPVFTTNFDLLLEGVMGPNRAVTITEETFPKIKDARENGQIPVIHLHGTLDNQYQVTEKDVRSEAHSLVMSEFRAALTTADAFVFVGYSFSDPDFQQVFFSHRQEIENRRKADKTTYVVSPCRDEYAYRLGNPIWQQRGSVWLPLKAGDFFRHLKTVVQVSALQDARKKVKRNFKIKDEAVLNDLVKRTADILRINEADAIVFLAETRNIGGGPQ